MTAPALNHVLALSGGVGGARMAAGLQRCLPDGGLVVLVNTGDDFEHLGLSISPDIDTVLYTLAGKHDVEKGWGRAGETWRSMAALAELGGPTWFRLGDTDLATHLLRTHRLREGASLSGVCAEMALQLGLSTRLLPMSDDRVRTVVQTESGLMPFQQWFVQAQCRPRVTAFRFEGLESAKPPACLQSVLRQAQMLVIGPSNPWVSVDPILRVPGLATALSASRLPVVAVSPIIGAAAVKGPAARMLEWQGLEVSAFGIAQWYAEHHAGLVHCWVIDGVDEALAPRIRALGAEVVVTQTLMHGGEGAAALADQVLGRAASLAAGMRS